MLFYYAAASFVTFTSLLVLCAKRRRVDLSQQAGRGVRAPRSNTQPSAFAIEQQREMDAGPQLDIEPGRVSMGKEISRRGALLTYAGDYTV